MKAMLCVQRISLQLTGRLHASTTGTNRCCEEEEEEKSYIIFGQFRADQMPGPPREVQLTYKFFLDSHHHV